MDGGRGHMTRILLVAALALLMTACSGLPGSAPTRFYIMKVDESLKPDVAAASLNPALNVGIGPVQIPGYADRAQIVTFDDGARINVSDFDHWAEPVGDAVKRILSANVSTLIGEAKVFPYPGDFRPDKDSLQIALEIVDIAQLDDGDALLSVRWHVKRLYENEVVVRNAKVYRHKATAGDYNSYANALSALLGKLSVDLTQSLKLVNS
jgi:uncharacterized lipoprotein YmbA